MRKKIQYAAKLGAALVQNERGLVWTGLLGLLLAAVCGVWVLFMGAEVAPAGDVSKAFSFNAALGIFILSTAAIIPFSGLGPRGKAFFRRSYIALVLYSYWAETVQHFRGVNPRFAYDGSLFDVIVSSVFGLVALLLLVCYMFLAASFFRHAVYEAHPALTVGIRYSMLAIMLSFAGGVWISVNGGSTIGPEGNLLLFHGLGFHALQIMPVIACLAAGAFVAQAARHALIHIAGIALLGSLAAIGWQTLLGRPLLEMSVLPLAAAACLLLIAAAALIALLGALRSADKEQRLSDRLAL